MVVVCNRTMNDIDWIQILKGYISALQDTLNESDPGVREASAEALGALYKFLGEGKVHLTSVTFD